MAYKIIKAKRKTKGKEIDIFAFKKNPNMAKEGDIITFQYKEDGALIKDRFKISEKYKSKDNIYFEDYKDRGIIIYHKKTKKFR